MITKLDIEAVKFEGGMCIVLARMKTEKGEVGSSVSFPLKKHPKLDALVDLISEAVHEEFKESLGIIVAQDQLAGITGKNPS